MGSADRFLTAASVLVSLVGLTIPGTLSGRLKHILDAVVASNRLRLDLSRRSPDLNRQAAEEIASAFEKHRELPPDAWLLIPQMIEDAVLTPAEIMAAGKTGRGVCEAMLAKLSDLEHRREPMKSAFRAIATPILERLLDDPVLNDELRPAFEVAALESLARKHSLGEQLADQALDTAQELGILKGEVIGIARIYSDRSPDNVGVALNNLKCALRQAEELRRRLEEETGGELEPLTRRIGFLNDQGRIEDAMATLKAALAERKDREEERRLKEAETTKRLLGIGLKQALISCSTNDVARFVFDFAEVERKDPEARLNYVRTMQRGFLEYGRRLAFAEALLASVRLSAELIDRETEPQRRRQAVLNHGASLAEMAYLFETPLMFDKAAAVFRAAAGALPRKEAAQQRASAHASLGAVLARWGASKGDVDLLLEAERQQRTALEAFTPEGSPDDWAHTQLLLGVTLAHLGNYTDEVRYRTEALNAYRASLHVAQPSPGSLEWANYQNNIAIELLGIGERGRDERALRDAIEGFESALDALSPSDDAGLRAIFERNLCNAYRTMGHLVGGTEHYGRAVDAARRSINARPRHMSPIERAIAHYVLGETLFSLGEITERTDYIEDAVDAYRAALEVLSPERSSTNWAKSQSRLGDALILLASRTSKEDSLVSAIQAYRSASSVWTLAETPLKHARLLRSVGTAEFIWSEITDPGEAEGHRLAALEACNASLAVHALRESSDDHDRSLRLLHLIQVGEPKAEPV